MTPYALRLHSHLLCLLALSRGLTSPAGAQLIAYAAEVRRDAAEMGKGGGVVS